MPARVQAHCGIGKWHDIEVEDDVTAYMEYDNGATATFVTTTGEAPGVNRLEIACERGLVVVEDGTISWTRNEVPTGEHCRVATGGFEKPTVWNVEVPVVKNNAQQHSVVLRNFCDAILGDAELIAPIHDGLNSVDLANGMLLSSFQKRMVEFPLDHAEYESFLQGLIATSKPKEDVVAIEADMDKSF